MSVQETVEKLRELYAQRRPVMKAQLRLDNEASAQIRLALGWTPDLTEKERKAICLKADKVRNMILKDKPVPAELAEVAERVEPFVLACKVARTPFDSRRRELERHMRKGAEALPVWPWAEEVRGFGALGLATIVGEAGDLGNYAGPAKLWKRMGLGLVGGEIQRKYRDKEKAAAHGYCPRRRSVSWNIGDPLIKGNDDGYRTLYDERKAYEMARDPEMSKGHAHKRAQRYME
ncbi:unnamed protein product, partial [marine sediment metagenome]